MVKSTYDESSRPLSGGFTGITSVRVYKNYNADLHKNKSVSGRLSEMHMENKNREINPPNPHR